MNKKRFLALSLAMMMIFALTAGCTPDETVTPDDPITPTEPTEPTEPTTPEQPTEPEQSTSAVPLDTFLVGTAAMNGDFIPGFSSNGYDNAIVTLTAGYMHTYELSDAGELVLNPTVVAHQEITTDIDGNKTYSYTLHDDLLWNNGESIMAKDFVASLLWSASPQWVAAGATSSHGEGLLGYSDYYSGATNVFSGVKLLGDYQFSLTIDAEELPYYWEVNYASTGPIYMPTYLPNAEIFSDELGAKLVFDGQDPATPYVQPDLTLDPVTDPLLLNANNIAATERFAPTVTCGPYKFLSYENQTVTTEINEYFKGDSNGNKPTFKYVIQQTVPQDTNVEAVISGQLDHVGGIVEGDKIERARSEQTVSLHSYLRAGYGYLGMHCDFGPTADVNVRLALASLIDRTQVVDYVLGGYGGTVDGPYGMAQWMYQELQAELQAELVPYSFNITAANDYLDQTEWLYEQDGVTPFDRTKASSDGEYFRYNEDGEMLTINHLGITENPVTDIIEIEYLKNAPQVGINFTVTRNDYSAMLNAFYFGYELGDERMYHTFNSATNLSAVDDKYTSWHSDFIGTWQNANQISDAQLDEAIMAMRNADPADHETYLNAWFDFQVRWNQLVPSIPLYSNEYFDIQHEYVDNFNSSPYAGYDDIICEISKSVK